VFSILKYIAVEKKINLTGGRKMPDVIKGFSNSCTNGQVNVVCAEIFTRIMHDTSD